MSPRWRVGASVLWYAVLSLTTVCSSAAAKETLVRNVPEFDAAVKAAGPGDTIILADGEWRDAELVAIGEPNDGAGALLLQAETPGKVVLTGTSRLRIGGYRVIVEGLLWKDSTAVNDVVSFRIDSKTHAHRCQLLNCAIIGDAAEMERKWVSIYGSANSIRNCRFEGKRSRGTLLVVWLDGDLERGHDIADNFFGPRERLGKNGGEIIRIGDSETSLRAANCNVVNNYFYRCSGEAEIISNKSCENTYQSNMFVGCGGALTLRHGNRCSVLTNSFFGDGQKGAGGVRVIGERHSVFLNLFYELTGDDTRAALSIMNGVVDSPANGYLQVRGAEIRHNLFVNCKETIVLGNFDKDQKRQTLAPQNLNFVANRVAAGDRPVFVVRTPPEWCAGSDNRYVGKLLGWDAASAWRAVDRETLLSEPDIFRTEHRRSFPPTDIGPEWLKPGEEFLPEVLKNRKARQAPPADEEKE